MPQKSKSISIAVIGAAGYSGAELLRLLVAHPKAQVNAVSSRAYVGKPIAAAHPQLGESLPLKFIKPDTLRWQDYDIVFFATPSHVAMRTVPAVLDAGARVIDISADFRLRNPTEWAQWYEIPHEAPELLSEAIYGLTEFHDKEIAQARLLANPGCYPTAILLGLLPLLKNNAIKADTIRVAAMSGLSGAGRTSKMTYMLTESHSNVNAYAASGHRHLPEILQELHTIAPEANLEFVPHLVPMSRGIHATIFVDLDGNTTVEDLHTNLREQYVDAPFVNVMPLGSYPRSGDVCGSNMCQLAVHPSSIKGHAVVLSVIDNLLKGAVGLAVQNMNLMCGLPQEMGLSAMGMRP